MEEGVITEILLSVVRVEQTPVGNKYVYTPFQKSSKT